LWFKQRVLKLGWRQAIGQAAALVALMRWPWMARRDLPESTVTKVLLSD